MGKDLLSIRQVWQINEPFEFSEEEIEFLGENPLSDKIKWDNKIYKPIRDRIRAHYVRLQNLTCAYCRLPIHGGTDNIEIEHIIDKNNRPDFTFESLNLVISCHLCNFSKKTTKVLYTCPPPNEYPKNTALFKIIHGHYDNYFENIEFRKGSIYHGKSKKGDFTIETCGLDRQGLAEQREEMEMYQNDPFIAKIIEVRNSGLNEELINSLFEQLKNINNKDGTE